MNNLRQDSPILDLVRTILVFTALLFLVLGGAFVLFSNSDELGTILLSGSATFLIFAIVIAIYTVVGVIKRHRREQRKAKRLAELPNTEQERKFLSEEENFPIKKEMMNTDGWNTNGFTDTPATGGRIES